MLYYLCFHSVDCMCFFLRLRLHRCCFSHLLITVGLKHRCQKHLLLQAVGRYSCKQTTLPFVLRGCSQVRSWASKRFFCSMLIRKVLVSMKNLVLLICYHISNKTHIPVSFHRAILTIFKMCAECKSSSSVKQTIEKLQPTAPDYVNRVNTHGWPVVLNDMSGSFNKTTFVTVVFFPAFISSFKLQIHLYIQLCSLKTCNTNLSHSLSCKALICV